ncbi:hypothetical protein VMF7928_04109 [Vibrio marisflavi CECT 7928]|nr:hypothetical protein VMF7928_04109 [Vibrio marisflavi CECT 7928]
MWQANHIDCLIVTSGKQLEYFLSQLDNTHMQWVLGLKLLVPSQRLVDKATQLGFSQTINTGGASNLDIVNTLRSRKQDLKNGE